MHLEFVGEPLGVGPGEGRVERGGRVGIELIEHEDDALCLGVADSLMQAAK